MIQFADEKTRHFVRDIWKVCFEDSEEFIELYFSTKYKDENTLVYLDNGVPVASLQLLPYTFRFYGIDLPVAYISGACTLAEYRNRGIMNKLLIRVFQIMQDRSVPLSILIPAEEWLFDYYARFDYAPVFEKDTEELPMSVIYESALKGTGVFPVFDRLLNRKDFSIQKTPDDVDAIIRDAEKDNFPQKTNVAGMARIIDVKTMLDIYAQKNKENSFYIKLIDKIIAGNTCLYRIKEGKCCIVYNHSLSESDSIITVSVSELCQLLFGVSLFKYPLSVNKYFKPHKPVLNLMLE